MKFKTLGVVSSLALVASLTTPAYAQNDTGDAADGGGRRQQEDGRTNVITVTAQFREQNLQDTPIAITAVNAEMLEARGQTNIAAVAAQAPNVSLTPQPQNGGTGLIAYIRGVGQTDFNYALDPGVGIYIDDVLHPDAVELAARADGPRPHRDPARPAGHAGRQELDRRRDQAVQRRSRAATARGSLEVTYGSFNRHRGARHGRFRDHRQLAVAHLGHGAQGPRRLRRAARLRR